MLTLMAVDYLVVSFECSIVQEGNLAAVEALLCPGAGGGWWARPSSKEVGLIITMWLQPAHVTRDT